MPDCSTATLIWAANPDVAAQGHDPLQHYVNHGIYEGRQRA